MKKKIISANLSLTTRSRKNIVFFGTKLFQIFGFLFVQTVRIFFDDIGCCWNILLSKAWDELTVCVWILLRAAEYVSFLPRLWTNCFLQKIASLYRWSVLARRKTSSLPTICSKFERFHETSTYFLIDTPSHFTRLCEKRLKISSLFKDVNKENIDSFTSKSTKYLFNFYFSCEEICKSKVFVDIAAEGTHWGLRTIDIKHKSFHQSKPGLDVELQNTHIVLLNSPRDVKQVNTFNQQVGLRSELVDWYRDAVSVLHGHLMIDLPPGIDNQLRHRENTGVIPSKI